jgi:hypothetical protein
MERRERGRGNLMEIFRAKAANAIGSITISAASALNQATLLAVVRCAMTLPLPHLRQRKRLTNFATGAPGLTPKRARSSSAMTPRC